MAMMLHGLDILRVNLYIVYKNKTGDEYPKDHKSFLMEYISALLKRGQMQTYRPTRSSEPVTKISPQDNNKKRYKMTNTTLPTLPQKRLDKPRELHVATTAPNNKQKECIYCRYLKAKQIFAKEEVTIKPREPSRMCNYCQVHICKQHFDVYHRC